MGVLEMCREKFQNSWHPVQIIAIHFPNQEERGSNDENEPRGLIGKDMIRRLPILAQQKTNSYSKPGHISLEILFNYSRNGNKTSLKLRHAKDNPPPINISFDLVRRP